MAPPKTKAAPAPRAPKPKALDLGILQSDLEAAAKKYKVATLAAQRAVEASVAAEQEYDNAKKALAAGVAQLNAAVKV